MLNSNATVTTQCIWFLSSTSLVSGLGVPDHWALSLMLFHKKVKHESVSPPSLVNHGLVIKELESKTKQQIRNPCKTWKTEFTFRKASSLQLHVAEHVLKVTSRGNLRYTLSLILSLQKTYKANLPEGLEVSGFMWWDYSHKRAHSLQYLAQRRLWSYKRIKERSHLRIRSLME